MIFFNNVQVHLFEYLSIVTLNKLKFISILCFILLLFFVLYIEIN